MALGQIAGLYDTGLDYAQMITRPERRRASEPLRKIPQRSENRPLGILRRVGKLRFGERSLGTGNIPPVQRLGLTVGPEVTDEFSSVRIHGQLGEFLLLLSAQVFIR